MHTTCWDVAGRTQCTSDVSASGSRDVSHDMPVESCDILHTSVAVSAEPHDVPVHAGMQTSWCTNESGVQVTCYTIECWDASDAVPMNAGMQVM